MIFKRLLEIFLKGRKIIKRVPKKKEIKKIKQVVVQGKRKPKKFVHAKWNLLGKRV